MKKYIFIILILLMLPFTTAYISKIAYKGWIMAGVKFNTSGEEFVVGYIPESNTTMIYLPNNLLLEIEGNSCGKDYGYEFCQTQQKYERGGRLVLPTISSDMNTSLYLTINITDYNLKSTRIENKTFAPIKIIMTLDNNDTGKIENFVYKEVFPDSVMISEVDGCENIDNTITIVRSFMPGERMSCTFRANSNESFRSNASTSYMLLDKIKMKKASYLYPGTANKTQTAQAKAASANITNSSNSTKLTNSSAGANLTNSSGANSTTTQDAPLAVLKKVFISEQNTKKPNELPPGVFIAIIVLIVAVGFFLFRKRPQVSELDKEIERIRNSSQ